MVKLGTCCQCFGLNSRKLNRSFKETQVKRLEGFFFFYIVFFKTPILAVIEDLMQKENLEECVKLVDSWGWGREDGVLFYAFWCWWVLRFVWFSLSILDTSQMFRSFFSLSLTSFNRFSLLTQLMSSFCQISDEDGDLTRQERGKFWLLAVFFKDATACQIQPNLFLALNFTSFNLFISNFKNF